MSVSEETRKEFIKNEKDLYKFYKDFSRFSDSLDDEETKQSDKSGAKKDESSE